MIYRLKAIMDYVHQSRRFVNPSEVASDVGMSWNTAKGDLNFLAANGYLIRRQVGENRFIYGFNYHKKV